MPEPDPRPPDPVASRSRLLTYAERLAEAAEDLARAGGPKQLAAGWTASRIAKALAVLGAASNALDEQVEVLERLHRKRADRPPRPPT